MADTITDLDWALVHLQQRWNELAPAGYRILSLSMYGDPFDPRYTTVWIRRPGPPQRLIWGYTGEHLLGLASSLRSSGLSPTIVTATGGGTDARFSAVFEAGPAADITLGQNGLEFNAEAGARRGAGKMLRWVTTYGSPPWSYRYAAVWEPNPDGRAWAVTSPLDGVRHQATMNAQVQQWGRPAFITQDLLGRRLTLYRDDQIGAIGRGWVLRTGRTKEAFLSEHSTWTAQGYYPLCVNVGSTTGSRFSVLFVNNESRAVRKFRSSGTAVAAYQPVDTAMKTHMEKNNIRSAAVAVARNGNIVYSRGFTCAEGDYPDTQPTSAFRIGSCSKAITSIVVHELIEEGLLTVDTLVKPLIEGLHKLRSGTTIVGKQDKVKVWHLLNHMSGYRRDPVVGPRAIRNHYGLKMPITKYDQLSFQLSRDDAIVYDPGTDWMYSNFGYWVLGLVVEAKTGQPYHQVVAERVFNRLGIGPSLAKVRPEEQLAQESRYHEPFLQVGETVLSDPASTTDIIPVAPCAYGVEDVASFDSMGGWRSSARDLAVLLADLHDKNASRLLGASTMDAMFKVRSEQAALAQAKPSTVPRYAQGFLDDGGSRYSHGGAVCASSAQFWHDRTRRVSVVALETGGGFFPDLSSIVASIA